MPVEWTFYAFAIPAVILVGLAKGGFAGLGALGMPLLALAMPPVQAAAILLPILIVQDAVGVWAFRKTWDGHVLAVTLPGAAVGIFFGWLLAARVSADAVLAAVGAISILFGLYRLWAERGGAITASSRSPGWVGSIFGMISGFTSQIAHAGAPPFQMWVMPRRLPRDIFIGTNAIFFAAVNWIKVPAYAALGQFTAPNLLATAALLPVAILATFAGVGLVRRVSAERFYGIVYLLMILVGAKLVWDAIA
ncbi:MAG: sulfite exporter TauE/SafE family protein [Sphingomonadaceae bacterium]